MATISVQISVAFLLSVDNFLCCHTQLISHLFLPSTKWCWTVELIIASHHRLWALLFHFWASVPDLISDLTCAVNSLQQIFVKALYLGLATLEGQDNFLHSEREEEHIYYAMVGSMEPSWECILKQTWPHSYMNSV